MHLHTFLAELHQQFKPKRYLEIGVQWGTSLSLASQSELAVGVDPNPLVKGGDLPFPAQIYPMTSDDFFNTIDDSYIEFGFDLFFIDGLHHAEQAMKDFVNGAGLVHPGGITVFDDVLPRNQAEAARTQCPGDWTGDVWRTAHKIHNMPGVQSMLVNTQPTGILVVTNITKTARNILARQVNTFTKLVRTEIPVPDAVLNREGAWEPDAALAELDTLFA